MHPTREGWSKVRYVKHLGCVFAVSFQDNDGRLILSCIRQPSDPLYEELWPGRWVWPEDVELLTLEEGSLVEDIARITAGPAFYLYQNLVVDRENPNLLDFGHE